MMLLHLDLKGLNISFSNGLMMKHTRWACMKAECRRRKDRLQISYEMLKDTLSPYQHAVKAARTKYFSDLINRTAHCPKALFGAINSVLNPAIAPPSDSTSLTCEGFLNFFVSSCTFDSFDHVSLPVRTDLVKHMKSSSTPFQSISLSKVCVPSCFKHAVVSPLIKKKQP